MNANNVFDIIKDSYNTLALQQNLSPTNKIVRETLDRLTCVCLGANCSCHICQSVLKACNENDMYSKLQNIYYQSELEMEQHWGNKFSDIEDITFEDLKQFYRFEKSLKVMQRELNLIKECPLPMKNIAFAGSGPFPMSALILDHLSNHAFNLDLIDYDPKAIEISSKYCNKITNNVNFIQANALELDYQKYDLVFIANMIIGKKELTQKLYDANVKYIIARSTENLSQLFYKPTNLKDFELYNFQKVEHGNNVSLSSSYLLKHPNL